MVDRFSSASPKGLIKNMYGLKVPPEYKPVFNASVKNGKVPVITADNPYRVELMTWGLMPFDSEDPLIATKLTNARAQTIQAKQPYCDMLEKKRCVIIMDGFYVWKEMYNVTTPYRVVRADGKPFTVAALWEDWKQEGTEQGFFKTFSMITVPAFKLTEHYNDRMPAILNDDERIKWLDDTLPVDDAVDLLKTQDPSDYRIYRVSNLVDDLEVNTSRIIRELDLPTPGDTLSLFD